MKRSALLGLFLLATTCPLLLGGQTKPYDEIIKDAQVQRGGITAYLKGGTYYLEIPATAMDRDLIWYAEISRGPYVQGIMGADASPGSMIDSRVVRLERRGDKLFVRDYSAPLDLRPAAGADAPAGEQQSFEAALTETNLPSVLMAFPIVAESPGGAVVVDGSAIFSRNLDQFDVKSRYPGATIQDPSRSYVDEIRVFDTNLRVRSVLTFQLAPNDNPLAAFIGRVNSRAATVEVVHSLYLLPEARMQPRLADPRIGYFQTDFLETLPEGGAERKAYISRYRLEKKDPGAALSEPVEPIVYYIGPNVPARWRPIFKQAVEDWNVAFEAAGFRNAIIAKDPPNDAGWDPNDLGFSVIRWVAQPIANARGPSVVDPRTGEILSAHVLIWEKVMELAAGWYYFEGSALDPQAREWPLPKAVQDRLMRYVVAHEVGHSIGLRHNHRASQAYTTEQLRDPEFANKYGPVASIMSYGRINYVAQPGDGVTELVPKIGPYDLLAVKYGYQPIPGARKPEAEIPTLNQWLEVQRTNDILLWGAEDEAAAHDPMVLTGNIGRDRIEATELGLKNLQRAVDNLPRAVGESPQDIDDLKNMYRTALNLRTTWLLANAKELYGVVENRILDPRQPQSEVISPERKREVTRFLLDQLKEPTPLITPELKRISMPYELASTTVGTQTPILDFMLDNVVINSLWEADVVEGETFTIAHYLDEIQKGLFSELDAASVAVDPVRRQLQVTFVEQLKSKIQPPAAAKVGAGAPDLRGAARLVLQELDARLKLAQKKATDITTRAHLYDLQKEIEEVL